MKKKFFTLEEGKELLGKDITVKSTDILGPINVEKGEIVAVAGYNMDEHEFELLTEENKGEFDKFGVHVRWHDMEREEDPFGTLGKFYNKSDFEEECHLRPGTKAHFFNRDHAFELLGVAVTSKINFKGRPIMGEEQSFDVGTHGIVTEVLQYDVEAQGWASVKCRLEDIEPFKEEHYASAYKVLIDWFKEEHAFMAMPYDQKRFVDECEIVYEDD